LEHATVYYKNNYWSAVTDGKRKYIWHFRTGQEQFFDLEKDPQENHDLIHDTSRKKEIKEWKNNLVDYLKERGEGFVKDGAPVKRTETMLYSPHYPKWEEDDPQWLKYWQKEEKESFVFK